MAMPALEGGIEHALQASIQHLPCAIKGVSCLEVGISAAALGDYALHRYGCLRQIYEDTRITAQQKVRFAWQDVSEPDRLETVGVE